MIIEKRILEVCKCQDQSRQVCTLLHCLFESLGFCKLHPTGCSLQHPNHEGFDTFPLSSLAFSIPHHNHNLGCFKTVKFAPTGHLISTLSHLYFPILGLN